MRMVWMPDVRFRLLSVDGVQQAGNLIAPAAPGSEVCVRVVMGA